MRASMQWERLPVYGSRHAIATSHPTATAIGHAVLASGGNAIDAALAAHAALCVVEPGMTGVGGDCFAIHYDAKTEAVTAINGSGWSPAGLRADLTAAELQPESPHAVMIPGAVDAWCSLAAQHGSRPLSDLFAPAVELAEGGSPVHARVAWDWAEEVGRLSANAAAANVFLPDGRAPRAGERHVQPALGRTLAAIGRDGRDAFYEGEIAEDMVAALRALGGTHTLADFRDYRAGPMVPIETEVFGHRIVECPPNTQGVIALLAMNLLEAALDRFGAESEADYHHLQAEVAKAAYAARDAVLADERALGDSVENLLSKQRAADIAATFRRDRASAAPAVPATGADTTYLCAVDAQGNAVSFINSLFDAWGSCIVAPKSGVIFNNRGYCFSTRPGHPNQVGPGKRPMTTIIPGMILSRDGQLVGPFGVMGGHYQAAGHAQFVANLLHRGMSVQQAINHPRSFATEGVLRVEPLIGAETAEDLRRRGHDTRVWPRPIGGAQAIVLDPAERTLSAGSETRKDGCAMAA